MLVGWWRLKHTSRTELIYWTLFSSDPDRKSAGIKLWESPTDDWEAVDVTEFWQDWDDLATTLYAANKKKIDWASMMFGFLEQLLDGKGTHELHPWSEYDTTRLICAIVDSASPIHRLRSRRLYKL